MNDALKIFEQIQAQKKELSDLKSKSLIYDFDYIRNASKPCWFKDGEQKMIVISKGYSSLFGVSQGEYFGKLDQDIHGEFGCAYTENDRIIYENKSFIRAVESWQRNGIVYEGEVRKVYDLLNTPEGQIKGTYGEIEILTEEVINV